MKTTSEHAVDVTEMPQPGGKCVDEVGLHIQS